ncbi:MAG: UvrD-helicase domain-containing protein [Flavobacteriaceae bacterium]|nr:UvrD-helicase domain-containing protein [Flavobacteriaceae bacterium]
MANHPSFLVYDASAGSGKTYTLVKAYLKIVLGNREDDSFRNILAITFTNKAAAEMKARILKNLTALADVHQPQDTQLLESLASELQITVSDLRKKAARVLHALLHNYGLFEVSTIDAFTVKIVRTFARDLRLSHGFEIDLDTQRLYEKVIELLFRKVGEDKVLTDFMVQYALEEIDESKTWDISKNLMDVATKLDYENTSEQVEKLTGKTVETFTKFIKLLFEKRSEQVAIIKQKAQAFFELINHHQLDEKDFYRSWIPSHFKSLLNNPDKVNYESGWKQKFPDTDFYTKTTPVDKKAQIDSLRDEIAVLFEESKSAYALLYLINRLLASTRPKAVISLINDLYKTYKKEQEIVTINEANQIIWNEVRNQPVPFIYERLGQRYRYFFIDEFQDTSVRQWQNLIPLLGHTLSVSHDAQIPGQVMLVGDAKQSIYRWRGGEPQQFMDLCRGKTPYPGIIPTHKILEKNYRSYREIVSFNNQFFTFVSNCFSRELYSDLYVSGNKQLPVKEQAGYVSVRFSEGLVADVNKTHCIQVLDIIRSSLELGFALSDICILVRTNKNATQMAHFLKQNRVPLVSADSLLLASDAAVCFLIAWLRLFEDQTHQEAYYEVLEYWAMHKLEAGCDRHDFISKHLQTEPAEFWTTFAVNEEAESFGNVLSESLYATTESIVSHFDLCKTPNAYVRKFLDEIHLFSLKDYATTKGFLAYWDYKKEKLSLTGSGADAVRIMTIHKAKGLEFPVVILPFANQNLRPGNSVWMDLPEGDWAGFKEMEIGLTKEVANLNPAWHETYEDLKQQTYFDEFNNMYVAHTRAVAELHILTAEEKAVSDLQKPTRTNGIYAAFFGENQQYKAGEGFYEIGRRTAVVQDEKAKENLSPEVWFNKGKNPGLHAVATQASRLWLGDRDAAVAQGNLIHFIMAEVQTHQDIDRAIDRAVSSGLLENEKENQTRQLLQELVRHPKISYSFTVDNEVYNERDLISTDKKLLRPDRLSILHDEVTIIDYKTGIAKPEYHQQVNAYAAVLAEMNLSVTKKWLVYLNENIDVVEVA